MNSDAHNPQGGKPATSALHQDESDAQEYFKVYEEHTRTLRLWLVAYGVGVPALIATSSTLSARLFCSGYAGVIALLFLSAAGLQVGLAFVNKYLMWALYFGAANPAFKSRWAYKQADRHAGKYWIDVCVDLLTMLVLALGTWFTLVAATTGSCLSEVLTR